MDTKQYRKKRTKIEVLGREGSGGIFGRRIGGKDFYSRLMIHTFSSLRNIIIEGFIIGGLFYES